jgi:hypothetical protein
MSGARLVLDHETAFPDVIYHLGACGLQPAELTNSSRRPTALTWPTVDAIRRSRLVQNDQLVEIVVRGPFTAHLEFVSSRMQMPASVGTHWFDSDHGMRLQRRRLVEQVDIALDWYHSPVSEVSEQYDRNLQERVNVCRMATQTTPGDEMGFMSEV